MNRISLYEALRRKKDNKGLNMPPQTGTAPQQAPRTEPRIQLKQPPTQGKPVPVPTKPAAKPSVKSPLMAKSVLFQRVKAPSWQAAKSLKAFIKNNPKTVWMGIAVVGALLVLLVFLIWIKLGQSGTETTQPVVSTNDKVRNLETAAAREAQKTPIANEKSDSPAKSDEPVKSQPPSAIQKQLQKPVVTEETQPTVKPASPADHVIVIAAYTKQEDLVPVAAYFRRNSIETEVIRQGSYYLLITKDRFENPERAGTDGYKMKQTIKRVGANYRAPDGYEKFSTTPFQDVYGKKMK